MPHIQPCRIPHQHRPGHRTWTFRRLKRGTSPSPWRCTLKAPRPRKSCIRHSASVVFDLGIRHNTTTLPPAGQGVTGKYASEGGPGRLGNGGLDPAVVETVILSRLHFDHIGDHSAFTRAPFVLGGAREHASSCRPNLACPFVPSRAFD
ncbi:hypothetical protein C8F04DRAFT_122326 [Mycena alexandri]|uniref:Uncharacterized protein n=1 Tax=Mycena alexandri TaxID=1745969 RepID=A0AAD6WT33_9AGAR|nr:hypothetical protein C8F04DRAFT_122326 [Mycena alexandri]